MIAQKLGQAQVDLFVSCADLALHRHLHRRQLGRTQRRLGAKESGAEEADHARPGFKS